MTDAQWAVELVRRAAASHFAATSHNRSTPRELADAVPRRLDLPRQPGGSATSTDYRFGLPEPR